MKLTDKSTPPDIIRSKIVGVTFGDKLPSGESERQWVLGKMAQFEIVNLELVRDPENQYDKDAIGVYAMLPGFGKKQVGHIRNSDRLCVECGLEYSKNAGVTVCEKCSKDLARNGLATELTYWIDQGYEYVADVLEYTGGNGRTRGCNIEIRRIS